MKPRESDTVSEQSETRIRKCLKCQEEFLSEWFGNRSCPECLKRPNHSSHTITQVTLNSTLSETGRRIGNRTYGHGGG